MAIGDKKPVVMEADRAVAGGIATLGADGKLLDAQIPGLDKLGAAPAGYGLGEVRASDFTTIAQVDAFKVSGVRGVYLTDGNHIGGSVYGKLVCEATDRTCTQKFSYYYANYNGLVELRRVCTHNLDWQEWEWVNPPMWLGEEYRTTERYNGNPVYVKLVNFGALPNATQSTVSHGISDLEYCIDVSGNANGYNLIGYSGVEKVFCGTSSIAIKTSENLTAFSANVLLKYTKTTD